MFLLIFMLLVGANGQFCGTSLYISPSGGSWVVRSPRYPAKYGPSTNCSWHVYTDPDKRLSLDCSFTELENEVVWNCLDKLSVVGSTLYDNEDFCEPFNAHSSSNNMTLKFTSWPQSKGGRFLCTVRAINKDKCDCGWNPKNRVVGGTEVKVNEFPMMVGIIHLKKRTQHCGGSIISKNFVLTAAHCINDEDVNDFGLLVGDHSLIIGNETNSTSLLPVAEFFIHPQFSSHKLKNDIALIKSKIPIDFNKNVGPVCLPFNRPFLPAIEANLTILGWGTTFPGGPPSDVLLQTNVKVVSESRCKAVYENPVSSDQCVCTFSPGHDSCQKDSGGPLIVTEHRTGSSYFLAALVSYGRGCGGSDPSVNTKITPYLDWIQRQTGDEFCIK